MRGRAAPVKRTDGFVATLIREVLADNGETERHDLHQLLAKKAKHEHGKRNSPQYRHVEESLNALEAAGEVERRYVPSQYDNGEHTYGRMLFKMKEAA